MKKLREVRRWFETRQKEFGKEKFFRNNVFILINMSLHL